MHLTTLLNGSVLFLLASTGLLVVNRQLRLGIALLTCQSLLLAGIAILVALGSGIEHLYLAVVLTVLVKAVLASVALGVVLRCAKTKVEREILGRGLSLSICVGLVLVSYSSVHQVQLPQVISAPNSLWVAISLVLIGLFMMVSRRKALMQIIGLVTIENGVFLLALSTTYGMPIFVEVGIFLDIGCSIIMLSFFAFKINQIFETLDITELRHLKG